MQDVEASTAELARGLMRRSEVASLATLAREGGAPYASLVLVATDHDASPILLLSTLAEHTRNLEREARISLLFDGTGGLESRLMGARLTLQGLAVATSEPRHRERFLRRHPDAEGYADFGDFDFYRVQATRAHLVAGFGRIEWIEADQIILAEANALPLVADEAGIVQHMNDDHADAVALYATALAGAAGGDWVMTGCDSEGIDLRSAGQVARVAFERPIGDAAEARTQLVALAAEARRILAESESRD
ncbi:MAG: DUF2470 domain-containing protein [Alphaproteobacteria bacterium]|jgi:hypothetical protein|nr:DUF2470 domain-containing protein [Alphaproteobacteria bacterium]